MLIFYGKYQIDCAVTGLQRYKKYNLSLFSGGNFIKLIEADNFKAKFSWCLNGYYVILLGPVIVNIVN